MFSDLSVRGLEPTDPACSSSRRRFLFKDQLGLLMWPLAGAPQDGAYKSRTKRSAQLRGITVAPGYAKRRAVPFVARRLFTGLASATRNLSCRRQTGSGSSYRVNTANSRSLCMVDLLITKVGIDLIVVGVKFPLSDALFTNKLVDEHYL